MKADHGNYHIGVLLFCTIFVASGYFHHPVDYDNSRSRLMLVSAIVDFQTFSIDHLQKLPHFYTIDASVSNGQTYSNKAPGAALIAIPVYWLIKRLVPSPENIFLPFWHRYLINLLTNSVLFALAAVVMWRIGLKWSGDAFSSLLMVMAFAFGSIAWSHSQYLSGHLMAGTLSFLGFACLSTLRDRAKAEIFRYQWGLAFSGGLLTGFGASCEYTAMFVALVLIVYMLWLRLPLPLLILFFLGGGIPLALIGYYNQQCFGSLFSTGYHHLALEEFAEGTQGGFLGISLPRPSSLFMLLFSPSRGLLFIMPVFIFSIPGLWRMWHFRQYRPEFLVISAIVGWYLLIIGGYFGWHGGWTYGPRYFVPFLPFLSLTLLFSPIQGWSFRLLLGLSVFLVLPAIIIMPHTPLEFRNPIVELMLPLMQAGYLPDTLPSVLGYGRPFGLGTGIAVILCLSLLLLFLGKRAKGTGENNLRVKSHSSDRIMAICVTAAIIAALLSVSSPGRDRATLFNYQKLLYGKYQWDIRNFK